MSGRLDGTVAIITGGASGIGRASVLAFLREGARVVSGDLNEASLAETAALASVQGHANRLASLRVDVSAEQDVAALVGHAVERFGGLDCIFNNAGVGGAFGPIGETTAEEWDFTFAVLVRGVFLGVKHASNRMKAQGRGGSIINTASIAGMGGGAGPHAYSAAKAAVAHLSRAVSAELAAHRIRVNAIAPGMIKTPLAAGRREDAWARLVQEKQPWPEPGMPQHIADAALFLASEDSRFITGQVLVVDGGLTAQGPDLFGHGAGSRLLRKAGLNTGSTGLPGSVREVPRP
ncbi:MAG TPA: SDR family oxidoreductase [Candidatus Dormibacteraeota bacterium]|jgi:NAD(P)-dependent dehydrogenase (short-subunit alcohol dehydrogenase family)|nr:SDR family oxidoreductase [Candidatus Dormibacteraeota bacterium]